MIYKGGNQIRGLYVGSKLVTSLYKGVVKIWELVNSCFGSGQWKGAKSWKGDDKWK